MTASWALGRAPQVAEPMPRVTQPQLPDSSHRPRERLSPLPTLPCTPPGWGVDLFAELFFATVNAFGLGSACLRSGAPRVATANVLTSSANGVVLLVTPAGGLTLHPASDRDAVILLELAAAGSGLDEC